MVKRENPPTVVHQWVERGEPHGPTEPRPSGQRDERPARALLVDVELDVADADAHDASLGKKRVRPEGLTQKKFTEPVALSSTQPADLPVARMALELSFDLLALRARCRGEPTGSLPDGSRVVHIANSANCAVFVNTADSTRCTPSSALGS